MSDKAWKRSERETAGLIGGERVPITGRQRGDAPDVWHDWLSVECKHRKGVPKWLRTAVSQALAAVRGEQLAVSIIHQHGSRHGDDLVVMRLSDFQAWFGDVLAGAPKNNGQSFEAIIGRTDGHR